MLHNYFKIAWRNLLKHKLFSFINIIGLSLAIPSVLMGLIQIVNYYEYDNFHDDGGRVVRIITDERQKDGSVTNWASSPVHLGSYIKENFAGIDNATTIVRDFDFVLSSGIKTKDINAIYTDKSFFKLFKFPLEKGIYPMEPQTIVLTSEMARWFFNDIDPVGHSLEHPTHGSFKIVGILKPFNQQKTQFRADVMVSFSSYLKINKADNDWSQLNAHTFLKLSKGVTVADLNRQLTNVSKEIDPLIETVENKKRDFKAQLLSEISPSKDILENDPYVQDVRSISLNFAFQLIIILLASLNYINLTLARSMNRSREVGVRKVAGATKSQLVIQFLTESVLISYIALAIGLFLLWVIKSQIHVSWLTWDIDHWGYLLLLFVVFNLILGLAAGASPSLILSSYQPMQVLKGAVLPASFGGIGFRKSLIVVQFTIALVYIFFIGHAFHQINYMANDNENYQRRDILNINLIGHMDKPLSNDVAAMKEVQKVGYTSLTFGNSPAHASIGNAAGEVKNMAYYYASDHNFIENMGLKILAGNNLIATDSERASPMILINQKAVEKLNLGSEQEAVGKSIVLNDTVSATVIGVVANFCHFDYEKKIDPVVFQYKPSSFKVMCLKMSPVSDRTALESSIKNLWKKHSPHQEMNASWLDTDLYDRYYPYEDMQFAGMEGIVIFVIAILGLIGILTYSLEKRTKEIGIRKVIGATTFEIVKLMSNDFTRLLVIATIIAIPLGIVVAMYMNSFFVFNNGIGYFTMCLFLSIVIGVSLAAVGYFSWRAAQTNPASTLKGE